MDIKLTAAIQYRVHVMLMTFSRSWV